MKQTIYTLTAATSTQVAAASIGRRYLSIINIGATNPASLGFEGVAVAGSGWPLAVAGPPLTMQDNHTHAGAVHAISTAGTTIAVLEG